MNTCTAKLVRKLLSFLLLLHSTRVIKSQYHNGIPFNLPGYSYCGPCEIYNVNFLAVAINELDVACKNFNEDLYNNYEWTSSVQRLLNTIWDSPFAKNYFWLFYAALRSADKYQAETNMIYSKTYFLYQDVQVVENVCVYQHIITGIGWAEYYKGDLITSDVINDSGLYDEYLWIVGLKNIWCAYNCPIDEQVQECKFELGVSVKHFNNRYKMEQERPWHKLDTVVIKAELLNDYNLLRCPANYDCIEKLSNGDCTVPLNINTEKEGVTLTTQMPYLSTDNIDAGVGNLDLLGTNQPPVDESEIGEKSCAYVINEFMTFADVHLKPKRMEFIELRQICPDNIKKPKRFPAMKILVLNTVKKTISTVVVLFQVPIPENGYFIVSEQSIQNNKFVHQTTITKGEKLLPTGQEEPIMIILLQKKDTDNIAWRKIDIETRDRSGLGKRRPLDVNIDVQNAITNTIIDAQIYGNSRNTRIDFIYELWSGYTGCNFILSEMNTQIFNSDSLSLNRCPPSETSQTFQYKYFKRDLPSAGNPNNCNLHQQYVYNELEVVQVDAFVDNYIVVGVTSNPGEDVECPNVDVRIGEVMATINSEVAIIHKMGFPEYTPIHIVKGSNSDAWLADLKLYMEKPVDFQKAESSQILKHLVAPASTDDANTPLICKPCFEEFQSCPYAYQQNRMDAFVKKEGFFNPDRNYMKKKALEHRRKEYHLYSILRNIRRDKLRLGVRKSLSNPVVSASEDFIELQNLFKVVYTEMLTNLAPNNHHRLMDLLHSIKASVGKYLTSSQTAHRMITLMATEMRESIFSYLRTEKPPVTIILDGSTTKRKHHYLMVYFQTTEGTRSIVYFYRLFDTGKSSTADTMFEILIESLKRDRLDNYIKEKFVAFVSDSASVNGKLKSLLDAWASRKGFTLYCLTHKLQLIARHAITDAIADKADPLLKYIYNVEKYLNVYFVFLKTQRRLGEYRDIMIEYDEPRYELTYFYANRWSASEYKTIKRFLLGYRTLWKTLEQLSVDFVHQGPQDRETASKLRLNLADKNFVTALMFLFDYTSIFSKWSLKMQYRAALLIDQYENYQDMMTSLKSLEQLTTPRLTAFLSTVKCDARERTTLDSINDYGCTLTEYEASTKVLWKDLILENTDQSSVPLSELGPAFVAKLYIEIEKYIPLKVMTAVRIFSSKHLPSSFQALQTQYEKQNVRIGFIYSYGMKEIAFLCDTFGWKTGPMKYDWGLLVQNILQSNLWGTYRTIPDAGKLWSALMQDSSLRWTPMLRELITTVMSIPAGSIAPESGFSLFNIIANQWRSSMSDIHIDSLLFLKINGPTTLEYYDAAHYARLWINSGHFTPNRDSSHLLGKQKETCSDENDSKQLEEDANAYFTFDTDNPFNDFEMPETGGGLIDKNYFEKEEKEIEDWIESNKRTPYFRSILL